MAPPDEDDPLDTHHARMNARALNEWYRQHPEVEALMPNVSQMIQSKFIGTQDVPVPQIVTIKAVSLERMTREKDDERWVMWFHELKKGLRLGNTVLRYLESTLGGNSDGWIGQRVRLYVDPSVQFAGRLVGGVRLQARKKVAQQATQNLYAGSGAAQSPRFDPMTGQPLAARAPAGALFDPMTGRPLQPPRAANAPPPDDFDPETGEVTRPAPPGDPEFDDEIPF